MSKTYIAFDADTDMKYYLTLKMWKAHKDIDFDFENAHELNNLRNGSNEETIKRKLRERMNESDIFVLLVGENTKNLYKFVRWEIEYALAKKMPIIVCNLNGSRYTDDLCPPILRSELTIHIPFKAKIITKAHDSWPASHRIHLQNNVKEPRFYLDTVYEQLGLNETDAEKKAKETLRLQALSRAYAIKKLSEGLY